MKLLKAYRRWTDLPLSRIVKGVAGSFLALLLPASATRIRSAPFRYPLPHVGRLIRNGLLTNAVRTGDHILIREFLADYWSSPASEEFYVNLSHRYESLFLRYHSGIVEETAKAVRDSGRVFRRMIEIGSGDGKVLHHFSRALPQIENFHGIDLNADQTSKNHIAYQDYPQLTFHHSDAREWMASNLEWGNIVSANGGVLEYFTRPELEDLFRIVAEFTPAIVAITESIAADHDLDAEQDTYPYGLELSLSHNYIALLKEAGFEIRYVNDRRTTPEESEIVGRWIQVVAVKL